MKNHTFFAIFEKLAKFEIIIASLFVCLFDLVLDVHSTIFQLCGTGLPGLNQY